MPSFAERLGRRPIRSLMQREELDEETRTELWNVFVILREILDKAYQDTYRGDSTRYDVLVAIWTWEFKRPRDEMRSESAVWSDLKSQVLRGEWFDVLDVTEAVVGYLDRYKTSATEDLASIMVGAFNNRFEHFLVAYRFVGQELTPLDSSAEADAVAAAQVDTNAFDGARHALDRAIGLLSDRQNPDYANSVKESISAVEAIVRIVTHENTLGAGLARLEGAGLTIHPALRSSWSKMYGWVSDADGIRHAGLGAADVDQALAKYVLVTSSAFVSYLIEEARKRGLLHGSA
ncbi:AbiJ-NTD4 domain-containing protein [Frigoribacterium sp. RIT-PI-h]|uniref:AbiJ-NTD4 domain-containing protein n=1 Tax=Frigoribacterium sp. RIT-PI-h TaxID=1690245 RepID=UPI0009EBC11C|nr:hypothetical protein [Frigoribacterium sp. RIT-PI-h]